MKSIEESAVGAMDGTDATLYTHLPYLMQDLWEFGADPKSMITLVTKHFQKPGQLHILDLGCGKGPVSVQLAAAAGCRCHGIDAVPEFIAEAKEKAKEYRVSGLCTFETGDIRTRIAELGEYDVIILGAIGPVFGDYASTMKTLRPHLSRNGLILIDDCYLPEDSTLKHPAYTTRQSICAQLREANMELADELIIPAAEIARSEEYIFPKLKMRCMELISRFPAQRSIFEDYIREQEAENKVLEQEVTCTVLAIRQRSS